jgi:hypothetical protein
MFACVGATPYVRHVHWQILQECTNVQAFPSWKHGAFKHFRGLRGKSIERDMGCTDPWSHSVEKLAQHGCCGPPVLLGKRHERGIPLMQLLIKVPVIIKVSSTQELYYLDCDGAEAM